MSGRPAVPEGWIELKRIAMSKETGLMLTGVGTLLLVLAAMLFAMIGELLGAPLSWTRYTWAAWIAGTVFTFVVHEWLHGLAMARFGARPRYGFGLAGFLPYFCTTSGGAVFTRRESLIVLLTPLVVIDLAALLLFLVKPMGPLAYVLLVVNTSGAVGDLWMSLLLLRAPREALMADEPTSNVIYGPPGSKPAKPANRSWGADIGRSLMLVFFGVVLLPVPVFILVDLLGVERFAFPPWNPMIAFADKGFTISLGPAFFWWMIGAAVLTLVLRRSKNRRT